MLPDDARHGTNAGYVAGCRQPCCRTAHADYRRDLRTRQYVARGPLKIDPTGTVRRIQALAAIGYPSYWIDDELGQSRTYCTNLMKHKAVWRDTAAAIATVYDRLSMTLPPTDTLVRRQMVTRTRNLALRNGWAPPMAWDDIDDINEIPTGVRKPYHHGPAHGSVDHAVVERVLAGEWDLHSTAAERTEICRRWCESGRSGQALERITGWKVESFYKAPCGTVAGWHRHRRTIDKDCGNEIPCDECQAAYDNRGEAA